MSIICIDLTNLKQLHQLFTYINFTLNTTDSFNANRLVWCCRGHYFLALGMENQWTGPENWIREIHMGELFFFFFFISNLA